MCIETVRVVSPKIKANTFICGADRVALDVPCGHCPECNNKRVNDLVFRCYHEYIDCDMHGGFTLFQTLTYSMLNTPYSGGFRFFKKADLQLFLKRCRKKLDTLGYNIDGNLKYIITCEYGSSPDGMHLPHYHVAFFSKVPGLDPSTLDKVIHLSWKHLGDNYTDSCELGFVDRRDTGLRVVNSIYGIRYICKYVYKGTSVKDALDYNKSSDITKFVISFCEKYGKRFGDGKKSWKYTDLKDWQIARIWKAYQCYYPSIDGYQLMPFYLQSKGLGVSFLELCSYDELLDVVQIPSKSPTGFVSFSIPLYYIRKVFYNYDKVSKRFILNELGKEFKQKTSAKMCEDFKETLTIDTNLLNSISQRLYGRNYRDIIDTALCGRSLSDFIHYCVFLKDRQVPQALHFLFGDCPLESSGIDLPGYVDVADYAIEFENNALDQQIADSPNWCVERFAKFKLDFVPGNSSRDELDVLDDSPVDPKKLIQISLPLHNRLPRFKGFDELYEKVQAIKQEFVIAKNILLDDKYKSEKNAALARSVLSPQNCIIY